MSKPHPPKHEILTVDAVRELVRDLPGIEEGLSYGTKAFKVKKKLIARFHQKEDALVIRTDFQERNRLIETNPLTYYITDHYIDYPYVMVRLPTAKKQELRELLVKAWRLEAPANLVKEYGS